VEVPQIVCPVSEAQFIILDHLIILNHLFLDILLLFKKSPFHEVCNYRPISLLSLVSKAFERCIYIIIIDHLSSQLYDLQYGFQSGKSTTAQMLYVLHEIHNVLEKRGQVDTVYLDFAKAFNKVRHDLLLVKLHNFGIRGNLLRWFGDYLSGRLQRVTVLGVTSEPLPVLSGVPQGSILGPLLFLIYVNDLPMSTLHDTTVSMFADDTKCHLRNFQDTIILQQDLDSVANWCNDWRMDLNQTKCVVMHFSRIAQQMITQYTLSDTPVLQSSSQKDLGITTTNGLKWNKQVQEISTKANKMLGFVKRTAFDIRQRRGRKVLYLTMVHSQLAYGSQVMGTPDGQQHLDH
jgi:sarcosine oxidase/L-pipecolate oxidase